jgi:UDP-2-acetamido-3-amino-2,3-dideoxy-glucuronate N-acetyltransferase
MFLHPAAIVESESIGEGTRIWAFAHILPGARIGRDCNICDHVFVEGEVVVGDRVTVKSGVQIWNGVQLENDVFVGPNATFTNDNFPRSRQYPEKYLTTLVRAGASIGANATILPGITIGSRAMIGAGSVVTRNVPADAIVFGNPARIVGYAGAKASLSATILAAPAQPGVVASTVRGVTLHRLPGAEDIRGKISFGEAGRHVPFEIRRYFLVHDVPGQHVRGEHAHREAHQFLICTHGAISVVADDGVSREEFLLDDPGVGLYLPPMVWGIQYRHKEDAVLLVLSSHYYDPADYVRDYDEFLALVGREQ